MFLPASDAGDWGGDSKWRATPAAMAVSTRKSATRSRASWLLVVGSNCGEIGADGGGAIGDWLGVVEPIIVVNAFTGTIVPFGSRTRTIFLCDMFVLCRHDQRDSHIRRKIRETIAFIFNGSRVY